MNTEFLMLNSKIFLLVRKDAEVNTEPGTIWNIKMVNHQTNFGSQPFS